MARTIGVENRAGRSRVEFCPLESAWGTWAEWAGVAVAMIVGVAIWRLTARTVELADLANVTNKALADLEFTRAEMAAQDQNEERRLLLVALSMPAGIKAAITGGVLKTLESPVVDLSHVARAIRECALVINENTQKRLHVVGNPLSARIARATTTPEGVATLAESFSRGPIEELTQGKRHVMRALKSHQRDLEEISLAALRAMREAGVPIPDPDAPLPPGP